MRNETTYTAKSELCANQKVMQMISIPVYFIRSVRSVRFVHRWMHRWVADCKIFVAIFQPHSFVWTTLGRCPQSSLIYELWQRPTDISSATPLHDVCSYHIWIYNISSNAVRNRLQSKFHHHHELMSFNWNRCFKHSLNQLY